MDEERRRKHKDYMPFQYTLKNPEEQLSQLQRDLMEDEPIMTEDERKISLDLEKEFKKKIIGLEKFLNLEYASFQNKVFRCMHNRCYQDIYKDRQELNQCKRECSKGINAVKEYTENSINALYQVFQKCMQESQKKSFTLENSFRCYEELNQGLEQIKLEVRTEFNYYE